MFEKQLIICIPLGQERERVWKIRKFKHQNVKRSPECDFFDALMLGVGIRGKAGLRAEDKEWRVDGETGLNKNPGQPRESSYGECLFCPQLFMVLFVSLCFSSPRKSQFCPLPYAQPHFSSRPGLLLCLPTLKATLQSQSLELQC